MAQLLKYRHLHLITELSEQQHNVITSLMLGDGSLEKKNINARLRSGRAQVDLEYLAHHYHIFKNLITEGGGYTAGIRKDTRTGNNSFTAAFKTLSLPIFTEYHNKWYKLNPETNRYVKIVPNDLELNAEIVAGWFCDDAYIRTAPGKPYRFGIRFATDGFTKDETFFLAELLSKRYNELFSAQHHEKDHYTIRSSSDTAARALISDIDKVFPPGMKRKRLWDHPEARFYENQPEKTTATGIISENIKQDLYKYLSTNFVFVARDVATALNYFDIVDGKPMTSTTIQVYLSQFVKDGYLDKVIRNAPAKTYFYQVSEKGKAYFLSQSLNSKPILYCNR